MISLNVFGIYAQHRIFNIPSSGGVLFIYEDIKILSDYLVQPRDSSKKNCYSSLKKIQYCKNLNAEANKMANNATSNIRTDIAFAYVLCDIDADFIDRLAIELAVTYSLCPAPNRIDFKTYQLKINFMNQGHYTNQYLGDLLDPRVIDIDF